MPLAGGGCWLLQAGRRVRRAAVRACQRRGCCVVRAAGGASTERGDEHDPSHDDGVRASHLTAAELAALRRLPPGQAPAARRTPTATSVVDGQPPRAPVGSNRRGLHTPRTRCGEDCCSRLNYDQNVAARDGQGAYVRRRRQNYGTYAAAGLDSDCSRVQELSRQYRHIRPTGWDDDDGYRGARISDRSTIPQQNSGRVGWQRPARPLIREPTP
ncbi:uncharacterized protein LOC119278881 isoform X1 [Triticum dicoccoides]|uniref:uncharacterized protein n=1 Tax=Triticum aestivum TaxID=4565 RepID=UPI0003D58EEF|nr:uncharacterized protein LOC119278881 isoform X1 [Triticum dicoccoides]XP_044446778.1 uncharacterized protein LOC123176783 [Triticum aestivum]